MKIPFAFMRTAGAETWPFGTGGDLVVLNGQTYTIYTDSIYDFNSIDVQAGGTLLVSAIGGATSPNPCILGCKGSFTVNGTVRTDFYPITDNTVFSKTDPLGNIFSYNSGTRAAGGNGGAGGKHNTAAEPQRPGGVTAFGAGGGGGGSNGGLSNLYIGGAGASPFAKGSSSSDGRGLGGNGNQAAKIGSPGSNLIEDGANNIQRTTGGAGGGGGGGAGNHYEILKNWIHWPGGGGGGDLGWAALPLAIVTNAGLVGSGTIQTKGENGYNGGKGGDNLPTQQNIGAGGGGGGGGGGRGGNLWIYHRTGVSVTTNTLGGSGGIGGPRGSIGAGPSTYPGNPGQNGQAGAAGTLDITTVW